MSIPTAKEAQKEVKRAESRKRRDDAFQERERKRRIKENNKFAMKTLYPKDLAKVEKSIDIASKGRGRLVDVDVCSYDVVKDKIVALLEKKGYKVSTHYRSWDESYEDGCCVAGAGAVWELKISW